MRQLGLTPANIAPQKAGAEEALEALTVMRKLESQTQAWTSGGTIEPLSNFNRAQTQEAGC